MPWRRRLARRSRDVRHGEAGRSEQSGFIIVAVLWILGALATLATIYALYTSQTALAQRVNDDRIQAEALIYAALELTAYQMTPVDLGRGPSGQFSFRMARADVEAAFVSEGGRIDLNQAPKELISGLFSALGVRKADADYDADRIIGWRTRNQEADREDEASAYRVAGLGYKPRRGPFQSPAELWLVLGLPPRLIERVLPFVTVYSGRADIDIAQAPAIVVAAQPGMTPEKLQGVLERRAGAGQAAAGAGEAAAPTAASEPRNTLRVAIRIAFENGRQVRAEIVMLLVKDDDEPYRILSWRDDFDGPV